MADSPTIQFSWLAYDVTEIEALLANHPTMDSFVFGYLFPETSSAIGLVAYVHTPDPNKYDPHYDILSVFDEEPPLELPGPVQMCDNVLSVTEMRAEIINAHGDKADFLVFVPALNAANYLYYSVQAFQKGVGGERSKRLRDDRGADTNPSPPAI